MDRFERDEVGQTDRAKVNVLSSKGRGRARYVPQQAQALTDLKVEVARVRQVRVRGRTFTFQLAKPDLQAAQAYFG